MVNPTRRELTPGEVRILAIIRDRFGDRNTPDEVFFTGAGEAALFIKAPDGNSVAAASLTNLAAWRADGTIATDKELETEWLPTI